MSMWDFWAFTRERTRTISLFVLALLFFIASAVEAGTIHEYKDTLSDSAPGNYSNHTVEFKTTVAIPAGGFITFIPNLGDFLIPAVNFDHKNLEIAVATSSGYINRSATTSSSATEDGISITPGSSGQIEISLNSTVAIPANARVRLRIGDNTALATTTDLGLQNPSATGTFAFRIRAGDGVTNTEAKGLVAIIENVGVGPVDTKEFDPPVRSNGAPTGTLSGTTNVVQMSLETDEFSRCRYSTASGTPYFSMGNEFTSSFRTIHPVNLTVATNTSYSFYIRCIDDEGNVNTDDYVINFRVPNFPIGVPGDEGDGEGEGGTGGTGGGAGSGSGGSSSGGSGGGGSGNSGSGSTSGAGGGGLEGTNKPYQSGDGRVTISGFAFPRSTVYVLVDGTVSETAVADGSGQFSVTIDAIARGVYTFGVYAIDKQSVKSSTFATTFTVTGGRGSTLSNINVMPSIKVTPDPVTPPAPLVLSGFAIPNALITIENQMDKSSASLKTFTTNSDASGAWSYTVDTSGFNNGTYKVRAKAKQESGDLAQTNFSGYTFYGVGQQAQVPRGSDLNRDGKVNLIDFSILLYWWNTAGGNSNPPADINGDGKVSLTDFSIMIFNWTG